LPTPPARAPSQEDLPIIAHQDDANVRAKAVCVDEICHE
jgi:hypothetical protein